MIEPELIKPRLEGTVGLEGGRRIGFAEFGDPQGRAVVWLHGTPGARRQIPHEARAYALINGIRIVGVDRPGGPWGAAWGSSGSDWRTCSMKAASTTSGGKSGSGK